MKIPFSKMNGAGNDFVMIDNMKGAVRIGADQIRALCHRTRGIGGDGLILLERAEGFDFRMRYYNSDGGEAEMCGNGARCAAMFAVRLGLGRRSGSTTWLRFVARPGGLEAVVAEGRAAITMTDATSFQKEISLSVADGLEMVHFIDTGVPHAVVLVEHPEGMDDGEVESRGRRIRYHERFAPAGANVDFVSVGESGVVAIRTYERGVEGETLSCGTGAVAAAVALAHLIGLGSPVRLRTHGGEELSVSFVKAPSGARKVVLEGPAALNFEGTVEL